LAYVFVNLHETEWAEEEYSTYNEGLSSQRFSMVPSEQYDALCILII